MGVVYLLLPFKGGRTKPLNVYAMYSTMAVWSMWSLFSKEIEGVLECNALSFDLAVGVVEMVFPIQGGGEEEA